MVNQLKQQALDEAMHENGNYTLAISICKLLLRNGPTEMLTLSALSTAYERIAETKIGEQKERWLILAEEKMQQATDMFITYEDNINQGRNYSEKGLFIEAIDQFNRAYRIEPDYPEAENYLYDLKLFSVG